MKKTVIGIIAGLAMLNVGSTQAQSIIYVDLHASGFDNGTSWQNAFVALQDALTAAEEGDEVWVARGIYQPDHGEGITLGDREASFRIEVPISLYGGYEGTETDPSERDWEQNVTRLSGDLLSNDAEIVDPERSDNSFHVVRVEMGPVSENPAIIDGFTISGGQADGQISMSSRGGGVLQVNSRLHLFNTILENNYSEFTGAAFYIDEGIFEVRECIFRNNLSRSKGGAINAELFMDPEMIYERSVIDGTLFEANRSENNQGGAISANGGPLAILNSKFVGNASLDGGAVYLRAGNGHNRTNIVNTVFSHNRAVAQSGGAISMENGHQIYITNSAFLFNSAFEGNVNRWGGAMSIYDQFMVDGPDVTLINTLFYGNMAEDAGAIYLGNGTVEIVNSIFWNNESSLGSPVVIGRQGEDNSIYNSIFEGPVPSGFTTVEDVAGLDPHFVDELGPDQLPGTGDEDFQLAPGSPAINAGDNSALGADPFDLDEDGDLEEALPVDIRNYVRIVGPSPTSQIVDLGPYEYDSSPVLVEDTPGETPLTDVKNGESIRVYPNPVTDRVYYLVHFNRSAAITIELYNVLGRKVFQSSETSHTAGPRSIDISQLVSGLYFLVLTSGNEKRIAPVSKS